MQSKNQDVGFSFTDNREKSDGKSRWNKYNRIKRNLRTKSRETIFSIRENDFGVETCNEAKTQTNNTPTIDSRVGSSTHRSPYIQVDISGKGYNSQTDRIYSENGIMGCLSAHRSETKTKIIVHNMQPRSPDRPSANNGGSGHLTRDDGITYCLDSTPQGIEVKATQLFNLGMNGRRQKESGEPSFTCDTLGSQGITIGSQIRRLTPLECERLQGYSDGWTKYGYDYPYPTQISDSQRYKCLGNAVTVNVIEAIIKKMVETNNI